MKKSTIWLLTIVMALTICGLLYVQIMYMRNMIKMRDDQFSEGVKRSLYAVTTALERDETRHYLDEDMATIDPSMLPVYASDGATLAKGISENAAAKNSALREPTLSSTLREPSTFGSTSADALRGQYLYQKGLLNEVILTILSQSSTRPIKERADSSMVRGYLRTELESNGLDLPFEFAIVSRAGRTVYATDGYRPQTEESAEARNLYTQVLFPNDPTSRVNYIRVYFPTKADYIFSTVKFMIPSFAFTLILLVIFVYTIIVAFRQKKLTEMKNDFINNMTHEFKTPISTISLAAQMLNDDAVRKSPTMLQHTATVINDETKRLRFQVEKVLQMSLFDRQKATLRLQDIDANLAIANIVHTFKLKVEKYGGRIEADLNAEMSTVTVDEMHFTNVIFNLLDNAVKYRREDTPLLLRVTTSDVGNRRLRIEIADNGIGIKKENLKKIFEKFYRVSTGNLHDVKGFGLGLAYVSKMVSELGGDITAESELGHGSKFIITLPLTKV